MPYAERYRELRPDAEGAWPAAFGNMLPLPLADGALAFSVIVDFSPEAKTSIATPLLEAGYASRPPLRASRSDIPGGPYPMTHLYMGARPADVLQVVFQSADASWPRDDRGSGNPVLLRGSPFPPTGSGRHLVSGAAQRGQTPNA